MGDLADLAAGRLIGGRYRVEASLGTGGMGLVQRVFDEATNRRLALKRLKSDSRDGDQLTDSLRFRREFHMVARLKHPHIVEVYDYGVDEQGPYYTMELLDGVDVSGAGPLSVEQSCRLLRDVASALAYLHTRNLLHRDLSHRNVRLTALGAGKLFDFGLLATAGIPGELVGTPPFVPPEAARGLPLDHRADLYGLGALAYYVLTGRHAYPARTLKELESAWCVPPAPPSAYAAALPLELDRLVLSLLLLRPLGRPSAAEVIETLSTIAGLTDDAASDTAHGYLASSVLAGRDYELATLRRSVAQACRGMSQSVLIDGPSGAGKSRLLREVALEGQLAGALAIAVEPADAVGGGAYALVRAVEHRLLAEAPEVTLEAARPYGPVLAQVLPELGAMLAVAPLPLQAGDLREDRVQLQAALASWLLGVTRARPLVLLVDNLQRCDEASAGLLASMLRQARGERLLLCASVRTDEPVRAPAAIAALRERGLVLRLGELTEPDVEMLVRALFGEVPNVRRLALLIGQAAGGRPLHCIELARHLFLRGALRYRGGEWVVPEQLESTDLPDGLIAALDARIQSLGPRARALGEALSVHGGDLPLERCLQLADWSDPPTLFAALDELVDTEILVGTVAAFRLRHDGLRESFLRQLDPARKRELHLRAGKVLGWGGTVAPEREAEVGYHLLEGGERLDGAALLERAGRGLIEARSFVDAELPLKSALSVYEQARVHPGRCLELKYLLLVVGYQGGDRALVLQHRDEVEAMLRWRSGLTLMGRVHFLGRPLALVLGLALRCLLWLLVPPGRRWPNPLLALRLYLTVSTGITAEAAATNNGPLVSATVAALAPLECFRRHAAYGAFCLSRAFQSYLGGRTLSMHEDLARALEIFQRDRLPGTDVLTRKLMTGVALLCGGIHRSGSGSATCLPGIERLEALGLRTFAVGALQLRITYHQLRGELPQVRALEDSLETEALRLGPTWMLEAYNPTIRCHDYLLSRDLAGLRRLIGRLERLVAEGMSLRVALGMARGEVHRDQGDLAAARRAYAQAVVDLGEGPEVWRPLVMVGFAETLLECGDLEAAGEAARQALEQTAGRECGQPLWRLRAGRTLALIRSALGDPSGAASALAGLMEEAEALGNPIACGEMHEAWAQVALAAGDRDRYCEHLAAVQRLLRPMENPALVARIERLERAGSPMASTADPVDGAASTLKTGGEPAGGA